MNVASIEDQRSKSGFRFDEALFPGIDISVALKEIMHSSTSKFQKVQVIRTTFGKTLVTDGKTQSAEMDEYVYHESLVHPSLLKCALSSSYSSDQANVNGKKRGPRSVFIGGGGELATAREVLRHKSVERLVMVDLDERVIEVCKQYLPEWGGEKVASNPRVELVIGDAHAYLTNCQEKFDAIIMDISDPIEAGPGILLYTQEFYQHAQSLLNDNGVFVTQGGVADGVVKIEGIERGSENDFSPFAPIQNTLKTVFDCVLPYTLNIPSFGSDWGFIMAFNVGSTNADASNANYAEMSPDVLDDAIRSYITDIDDIEANVSAEQCKSGCDVLKYYDGLSHRRMFALPKPLRDMIEKDKRIMTVANPVYMY